MLKKKMLFEQLLYFENLDENKNKFLENETKYSSEGTKNGPKEGIELFQDVHHLEQTETHLQIRNIFTHEGQEPQANE